jgi:alpha-N-arabinofuranosidase
MSLIPTRVLLHFCFAVCVAWVSSGALARGADIDVTVQTDRVANTIHPHVYGHFFEHIYHSANNGLWGDVVWNRSFEQNTERSMGGPDGWYREGDAIVYEGSQGQARLIGGYEWRDMDFTVEARRTSVEGALRVFPRFKGTGLMITLGANNNSVHLLDRATQGGGRRGGGGGGATAPASAPAPLPPLAEPVKGSIETNKWHAVRVRIEGRKLQAWLDGNQIFDAELPAGGRGGGGGGPGGILPQGYIGVGVSGADTKAQFRNFKVVGLDGKVYWDRPLYAAQKNSVSEKWSVEGGKGEILPPRPAGGGGRGGGGGQAQNQDNQPPTHQALNDRYYLHLTNSNGPTVLWQGDLMVKAGDALEGSLWLKGSAPSGATVQLVNGNSVLAQAKIAPPRSDWAEYPVRLDPSSNATAATLKIVFDGAIDVGVDQVSLMAASSKANGGFNPMMYKAFEGLGPTVLRWPGGCYAETYKWKHGIGKQHERKKGLQPWWEEFDPNALGTDEFIQLCRKIGAEPLIVINTGMHVRPGTTNAEEWAPWIKEACEWIEYCNGPATSEWGKVRAANGHPEPYNIKLWEIDNELWRSASAVTNRPETYAEAIKHFGPAMRKVDPSITVIGHGGNGTDRRYNDVILANAAEFIDVLSIHHYTGPERFVSGVGDQDRLYDYTIRKIAESKNPKMKLYVSEWNAQTTDWRTGIYAGGLLNVFEKHGEVLTMAGPALMARHASAHDWDNAFINFDVNSWFAGPNYVVMKLWRENFAPQRLMTEGGTDTHNIIATKTEDGSTIILKSVNQSSEPQQVTATLAGGFKAGQASMQLVAPGSLMARNTFADPNLIAPKDAPVSVDSGASKVSFTMPPYSAAVVRVKAP